MKRVLFLLVLILTACNDVTVTEGRIVDMQHKPEWIEHYSYKCGEIPVSEDYSIPVMCDGTRRHAAWWRIVIQNDVNGDGKMDRDWVSLPEKEWDTLSIGDYYVVGQGKVLK